MVWGQSLLCIFSCFWRVYFAKSIVVLLPIAYTLTISLFLSKGIYVLFTVVALIFLFACIPLTQSLGFVLSFPLEKMEEEHVWWCHIINGGGVCLGDRLSWQRMQVSPSSLFLLKSCYRLCIFGPIWGLKPVLLCIKCGSEENCTVWWSATIMRGWE